MQSCTVPTQNDPEDICTSGLLNSNFQFLSHYTHTKYPDRRPIFFTLVCHTYLQRDPTDGLHFLFCFKEHPWHRVLDLRTSASLVTIAQGQSKNNHVLERVGGLGDSETGAQRLNDLPTT